MVPRESMQVDFQEKIWPSKTFKADWTDGRLCGTTDGLEAVRQAVYHILRTPRYMHVIYSRNYGVELDDLFGMPVLFVMSELKRRIEEALEQDDRITGVDDFQFVCAKGSVSTSFIVHTVFGDLQEERTVEI